MSYRKLVDKMIEQGFTYPKIINELRYIQDSVDLSPDENHELRKIINDLKSALYIEKFAAYFI